MTEFRFSIEDVSDSSTIEYSDTQTYNLGAAAFIHLGLFTINNPTNVGKTVRMRFWVKDDVAKTIITRNIIATQSNSVDLSDNIAGNSQASESYLDVTNVWTEIPNSDMVYYSFSDTTVIKTSLQGKLYT